MKGLSLLCFKKLKKFIATAAVRTLYLHVEKCIEVVEQTVIVVNAQAFGLSGKIEQWSEKWKSGLHITKGL